MTDSRRSRPTTLAGLAGLVILASACGGGETAGSSAGTPLSAAPSSSEAVADTVATTPTTDPPAPTTTAAPDRPADGPLEAATPYRVGDTFGDVTVSFTTGSQPLTLFYGSDGFTAYDEAEGVTSALTVLDLATLSVAVNDAATGAPVSREPVPADVLQWLADQPLLDVVAGRAPITAGGATGEVISMRTIGLPTATDGSFCGGLRAEMTGGDPFDFEPEVGCAGLFISPDGSPFTTFPGTVSEFAVLRAGATNLLVITERPADSTVASLLPSVTVEV